MKKVKVVIEMQLLTVKNNIQVLKVGEEFKISHGFEDKIVIVKEGTLHSFAIPSSTFLVCFK